MDDGVDDAAADHDSGVIILVASLEKATEASDMVAINNYQLLLWGRPTASR